MAISNNNIEMVQLLINQTNLHHINLYLNEKKENGNYSFLIVVYNYNIEIVKLLIEYPSQNQIIFNINEKDERRIRYPLLEAIYENEYSIKHLLILINICKKKKIYTGK